jgi:hypothetical protein
MAKPIIGANRKSAKIEIVLPVDANGAYAFDENGDPVKGRTPVEFTVPRFDCMTREQFKELNSALAALDDKKDENGEPLSPQDRGIEVVLAMLKPFVTDDELAVVEKLHLFELEQIAERIQEGSTITVGELVASTSS